MKRILILLSASLLTSLSFAQTLQDAYRFSHIANFGTSRGAGLGNSMGALGADFYSASFNPAGIRVFPQSNMNVDFGVYIKSNENKYHGVENSEQSTDFSLSSIGFVKAFKNSNHKIRFGIGVNNLANFNNHIRNEAYNNSSSRLYSFLQNANGTTADKLNAFREQLAFNTYLLDYDGSPSQYKIPVDAAGQDEYYSLRQSGQMNETVLAIAFEAQSDLNIGFSLGFPSLNYEESSHYRESNFTDSTSLDYFSYRTYLNTVANGINLKLGFQYNPADFVRLGFAFHSPTWYSVSESFSAQMAAYFLDSAHISDSPIGLYDYDVTSPIRIISSAGFIFGTKGLISLEHEYLNYAGTKFNSPAVFSELNESINESFAAAHRVKIGGELNLFPVQLRAGYAISTSPFKTDNELDFDGSLAQKSLSLGASVNMKNWRLNLACTQSSTEAYEQLTYATSFYESVITVNERFSLLSFGVNYQF